MADPLKFTARDGLSLYGVRWAPDGEVKADVLLLHGYAEHVGRYEHVAAALVAAGYRVTGFDLRGHGRSDGRRGHVERFSQYLDDVEVVAATLESAEPFVLGHSTGGLIALDFLRDRRQPLKGIVATAPLLEIAVAAPGWKKLAGRALSRIVPGLHMGNELDPHTVCRDKAVADAYAADPLVFTTTTPRWFTETTKAMARVVEAAPTLTLPAMLAWGSADVVASPGATKGFAARYGGEIVAREWEGLYHEVMNEPERAQVLAEIVAWLDRHVGADAPSA